MATKTFTFPQWLKAMRKHDLHAGDLFTCAGPSIVDAAKRLGVSDQRIRQLIEADRLDCVRVVTWKGNLAATMVTEASLEAYEPRPTGRPVQLELATD